MLIDSRQSCREETRSVGRRAAIELALILSALILSAIEPATARAYVEIPYSLGRIVQESTSISVLRIEKVERERNLILFKKVQDLKGTLPQEVVRHNIGRGGFHEREWKAIMEWAEPGKTAVFFNNGGASETCINNYWYQAYAGGEWWNMSHGEPYMLRSFAGSTEKLAAIVAAMVAGQEVVVPCMVDGDKQALQTRSGRIQRLRASLKIQDYNAQRDFAGWGGDDFRTLAGMPAFSHYAGVTRTDPDAGGIAVADVDGDGKDDVCYYGAGKVTVLRVEGSSLSEVALPITGGARSAAFGDANGDGKPDLLLATPSGPKLLINQGGTFKDESAGLPREPYYQLSAAAWIDQDGDGRQDIVLANGYLGLRLYRNLPTPDITQNNPRTFADISTDVKLGPDGVAATMKGDHMLVADWNGDGRADLLYGAGTGVMLMNTPAGFSVAADAGVQYQTTKVRPAKIDLNGDKLPDLVVPHATGVRLLVNGGGKFTDVTAASGDAARAFGAATSVTAGDLDGDGKVDLVVGCLRAPNRLFRGQGGGKFADATVESGLIQRIFNTRGVAMADVNRDGASDVLFNNEGQESAMLLGAAARPAAQQVGRND